MERFKTSETASKRIEDAFEDLIGVDDTPMAQLPVAGALPAERSGRHKGTEAPANGSTADEDHYTNLRCASEVGHLDHHGSNSGSHSSGAGRASVGPSPDGAAMPRPTELIIKLERRGVGWGEEIFPHIVVENRPIEKPSRERPRSQKPDPWQVRPLNPLHCLLTFAAECFRTNLFAAVIQVRIPCAKVIFIKLQEAFEAIPPRPSFKGSFNTFAGPCHEAQEGSLERFLESLGIGSADVDAVVRTATMWRVTKGGRSLVDRRRRTRVERNVYGIVHQLSEQSRLTNGLFVARPADPMQAVIDVLLSWHIIRFLGLGTKRCKEI